jgi:ABC-type Fe3+ transport system substrate-binding protein
MDMLQANREKQTTIRTRRRSRVALACAGLLAILTAVAACGGSSASGSASSASGGGGTTVQVWTSFGDADTSALIAKDFKASSDLTVSTYKTTEAPLVEKFYAASSRNQSPDLVFLTSTTDLVALQQQGLLANFTVPAVSSDYPKSLLAYAPYAYPVTLDIQGIGYNTNLTGGAAPGKFSSWSEIFQPQYTGKFGMLDPDTVGGVVSYLWIMKQELGDAGYLKFLDGLKALKPKFYPANASMTAALSSGQVSIAWVYDAPINTLVAAGAPVAFTYPPQAPAIYGLAVIPKNAPDKASAVKFLNYLLGVQGQVTWSSSFGDTPANPKAIPLVKKAMATKSWYQAPTTYELAQTTPTTAQKTAFIKQFDTIVKGE